MSYPVGVPSPLTDLLKKPARLLGSTLVVALVSFFIVDTGFCASALLEWEPSPSPNVVGYDVFFGDRSSQYFGVIRTGNTNRVVLDNLSPGSSYYFAVKAVNRFGMSSGFSNEVVYQPGGGQVVRLRLNKEGSIQLQASAPAGSSCEIHASTDLVNWAVIGRVSADAQGAVSFSDPSSSQYTKRFYRLRHL